MWIYDWELQETHTKLFWSLNSDSRNARMSYSTHSYVIYRRIVSFYISGWSLCAFKSHWLPIDETRIWDESLQALYLLLSRNNHQAQWKETEKLKGHRNCYSDSIRARLSGVRSPVEARFSAPVQASPRAHAASCIMDTGSFSGGEAVEAWC